MSQAVEHDVQRAARDDRWIQLFQRTGCGVSGIREWLLTNSFPFFVQLLEAGDGHIDLASNLHNGRKTNVCCTSSMPGGCGPVCSAKDQRDGADSPKIFGNVITRH